MLKIHFGILTLICAGLGVATIAQQSPDIGVLFAQLSEVSTTDEAFKQILIAAKRDPRARAAAIERLPPLIEKNQISRVWLNVVVLAGKLKAENATPALIRVLPHSPDTPSIIVGFADSSTLRSDPVGQALCDIGDPALPALTELLKNDEKEVRRRAARILWNMNTPASRRILRNALDSETDPGIRQLFGSPKAE